jgi:hypothetical protein
MPGHFQQRVSSPLLNWAKESHTALPNAAISGVNTFQRHQDEIGENDVASRLHGFVPLAEHR